MTRAFGRLRWKGHKFKVILAFRVPLSIVPPDKKQNKTKKYIIVNTI